MKNKDCDVLIALAGNPNVGKSTLFNVLTGETAHVGNWPGVTVELKEGLRIYNGKRLCFVDLPGTYGISATSLEEVITREFIISERPDIVAVLVDSTAPERTIYLALQILELTPNVVIVFTKVDEAHSSGVHIHFDKLEQDLGVPVVPVSALKGEGVRELLETLADFKRRAKRSEPLKIDYNGLEYFIGEIERIISKSKALSSYPRRWAAVRLLEGDDRLEDVLAKSGERDILKEVERVRQAAINSVSKDLAGMMMKLRFEYADSLLKKTVVRSEVRRPTDHDIFQRPIIGPLLSLTLLFLVFLTIFAINTGFPLNVIADLLGRSDIAEAVENYSISGLLDTAFTVLADMVSSNLSTVAPHWLVSLLADGIISGLGAVLSFFPLIFMVFLFLAALEDSGLAPRMATSFHSLFAKFGLSGRAIYPYLISLGCNVPGVMASRASLDDAERYEVILSAPFIPCQARLVVALAFATAITTSPILQAGIIVMVYGVGIFAALLTALLVRRVYFKTKEPPELILELPPLHKPKAKVVWWLTWDNTKHFLRKAGLIIFSLSIVVWALLYTGPQGYLPDTYGSDFFQYSYAAIIGKAIAPALTPFGFTFDQGWRVGFALFNGFIAKEVVLSSIQMLYGQEVDPVAAIRHLGLTPTQMLALLVFIMLYVPCMATVAVMYQESKKVSLTLASIAYMIGVAYVTSLLIYGILNLVP
jgi:ferrous iron transport protein B